VKGSYGKQSSLVGLVQQLRDKAAADDARDLPS
jgi:hypothetical protein